MRDGDDVGRDDSEDLIDAEEDDGGDGVGEDFFDVAVDGDKEDGQACSVGVHEDSVRRLTEEGEAEESDPGGDAGRCLGFLGVLLEPEDDEADDVEGGGDEHQVAYPAVDPI